MQHTAFGACKAEHRVQGNEAALEPPDPVLHQPMASDVLPDEQDSGLVVGFRVVAYTHMEAIPSATAKAAARSGK